MQFDEADNESRHLLAPAAAPAKDPPGIHTRTLSVPLLAALYFFTVAGGPIGSESIVSTLGPLVGLVCLAVYPFIYSLPISLTTAELSAAYSESGGYVHWCYHAFGPRTAFVCGALSYLSGIADSAIYPGLFVSYMTSTFGALADDSAIAAASKIAFICFWFMVVFSGIKVVGQTAFVLGGIVLLPFFVFVCVGLPQVDPARWLGGVSASVTPNGTTTSTSSPPLTWTDYCTFASVLYWNFSGGDQLATFAGEVKEPRKTYPKAAVWGVAIVALNYMLPLLVVSGVLEPGAELANFTVGGFPEVAEIVGGVWLKWMVLGASWLGCCALFFTEISEDSFLLLGMSEMGLAPSVCRSRHATSATPTHALITGSILVTIISLSGSFVQIVALDNAFNCASILLELAAAVWLRFKMPDLERPFKFPVSDGQLIFVLAVPTLLTILVGASSLASDSTGAAAMAFFCCVLGLLVLHEGVLVWRRCAYCRMQARRKTIPDFRRAAAIVEEEA
jgi:amino acid transporter